MWLYATFDSIKGASRVGVAEWFALIVLFVVTAVIIYAGARTALGSDMAK
jgi:hypothetical protein